MEIGQEVKQAVQIDASGIYYRELNTRLKELVSNGAQRIELRNVYGQRYIGTNLNRPVEIDISGTPGNDLGAFMDGPRITVHGNAQDGCGNTMNNGEIIVHGHAGDIIGLSARGGKIFVRDSIGYRAGIHMKEYQDKKPMLVIGGTAQDFFGEYMAGGFAVIKDVPKTVVYKLSEHRNSLAGYALIPTAIIDKEPSAELRPEQKDADTLPRYDQLDPILTAYVEEDKSIQQIIDLGFNRETVEKAARLVDSSEYKRRQASPGVKITPRAFGRDRRLPITNQFKEW